MWEGSTSTAHIPRPVHWHVPVFRGPSSIRPRFGHVHRIRDRALVQNSAGLNPGKYLNSTWLWNDSSKYYTTGVNDNLYADALHNLEVHGKPAFINQQVYALSYDDQGGHSPSLFFGPSLTETP